MCQHERMSVCVRAAVCWNVVVFVCVCVHVILLDLVYVLGKH